MKIYVGRWDLLPKEWEGINGLYEKSEEEIAAEISREVDQDAAENRYYEDNLIAIYEPEEFEETFNGDNESKLHGTRYWIKIF